MTGTMVAVKGMLSTNAETIAQLKAQGPSRTCNERKEEAEEDNVGGSDTDNPGRSLCPDQTEATTGEPRS